MTFKSTMAAGLATFAMATAAPAATYTFTLNESGDPITRLSDYEFSIDKTVDGQTLTGTFTGIYIDDATFSGDTLSGGSVENAATLERYFTGAGVCGVGDCYDIDTRHTVDGVSDGSADFDMIQMAFRTDDGLAEVTIEELVFGYVGRFSYRGGTYGYRGTNGSFEILTDALDDDVIGIGDLRVFSGNAPQVYRNGVVSFGAGSGLSDSVFGIKTGENGSWKLLSATVTFTPLTAIPVPASGLLLLAGLGGLAALRRRKRGA